MDPESTSRTRAPRCAIAAETLIAVVVLPTPPFWLAIATMRPRRRGGNVRSGATAPTSSGGLVFRAMGVGSCDSAVVGSIPG